MGGSKDKKHHTTKGTANNNRIELKPDHIKMLREKANAEQDLLLQMAHVTLRLRSLEKQYKEQKDAFTSTQDKLHAEISQRRSQIMELGQSVQAFYNLEEKQGYQWQLNIEEGVWVRVLLK